MSNDNGDLDSLIKRLNALRPSSITPGPTNPIFNSISAKASVKNADLDKPDLNARFASLSGNKRNVSLAADELAAHPENLRTGPDDLGFSDVQAFDESGASFEDVLANLELGDVKSAVGMEDWRGEIAETRHAQNILQDAKRTLKDADGQDREESRTRTRSNNLEGGDEDAIKVEYVDKDLEQQKSDDDSEAEDFVRKAIDQARQAGPQDYDDEDTSVARNASGKEAADKVDLSAFSLPEAPSELPTVIAQDNDHSLALPAAPTFQPAPRAASVHSAFSEEDDETWCTICMDDATLQCIDCDGDLYCERCWNEGHKGESASIEERRHKAMLYENPKKKKRQQEKKRWKLEKRAKIGAG
ncbi:MAG: hypothetical protein Q9159_000566 [Coniocarpon cinnabarinum]